ncbi:MAG: hypothetical protein ACE5LQ_01765 [Candidatus Bipolaricaulia bacterium]
MNRKVLSLLIVVLFAITVAAEIELQEFLHRLEEAYSSLQDLQATVAIKQSVGGGKEKDVSRVQIGTLVKGKVLRVEFLDPREMRGEVLTLKGYQFSQYLPVTNTIYVQEITEKHMFYPLLEFLNFDLEEIVTRLQKEGFSLSVSQRIIPSAPTAELDLVNTVSELAGGHPASPLALGLSLAQGAERLLLGIRVSGWRLGDYLLEAIPREEGPVSKELIWIDPLSLIPRRVETHYVRQVEGRARKEVTIYLISDVRINQGLTEEELLALPKDARIVHAPSR